MYRKLIIIIIFVIGILNSINIRTINKDDKKIINVEVKGNIKEEKVIKLPLGSTFNDLLKQITLNDNADLSSISSLVPLYNNQVIIIPAKNECKKISINSANINELSMLPGIGISIANNIINYRETNGSFTSIEDIKLVKGIGDKKFEKIKEYICL